MKVSAALICCASLAGCLGLGPSNNGGGGGGAAATTTSSLAQFDSKFNEVSGLPATLTKLTGTAEYTGKVSIRTDPNAPPTSSDVVVGDLDMDIDFDNGTSPITATATNFNGSVNGQDVTIDGTLSTANAQNQVNAVTSTNTGVGTVTGISVGLEGALSDPNSTLTGDALMTLQGTFRGDNGAAINGASGLVVRPSSGPNVVTGGQFYAERN
ncbi:MAG: hypothetical protein AAGH17_03815 [Pseudomonadota bacterium]